MVLAGIQQPCDDQCTVDNLPRQFRPLYTQVYESLLSRIVEGEWRPGEALPSEQALAIEMGVSQGTIRKALDTLEAEKIIDRRQGKGTFVAELTQEQSVYRFFRLTRPDGRRTIPSSGDEVLTRRAARPLEQAALFLDSDTEVFEILRTRFIDGVPIVIERTVVPVSIFPSLETHSPLPNALFALYQSEFSVNVVSTDERLRADRATDQDVARLGVELGAPLLEIERVAVTVTGMRVEWRLSRCNTDLCRYGVILT